MHVLLELSAFIALGTATLVVAVWLVFFLRARRKKGSKATEALLPEPAALPIVVSVCAAVGAKAALGDGIGWAVVQPMWISVFSGAFFSGLMRGVLPAKSVSCRKGVTTAYIGVVSACLSAATTVGLSL